MTPEDREALMRSHEEGVLSVEDVKRAMDVDLEGWVLGQPPALARGMLLLLSSTTRMLVGDLNEKGGTCDHCEFGTWEVIAWRKVELA